MSSNLELRFKSLAVSHGLKIDQEEYRFHPSRKWRFDFAWPKYKIAVEVEGGNYSQGRHTRGKGFTNDCEKYNSALQLGWKVLRFTGEMLNESAINQVLLLLECEYNKQKLTS